MQNLQTLRRRIRSVQNTQKITRAMQMVAGAKLRRMQAELVNFKPYAQRIEQITKRFLASFPGLDHPYLASANENPDPAQPKARTSQPEPRTRRDEWGGIRQLQPPVGLLVISSDTGLCGTYNERIFAETEKFLMEHPSAVVVTVGKKGNRLLTRRGIPRTKEILDWSGRFDPAKVAPLVDWMEDLYITWKVSAWWVSYTRFISALQWKATVDLLLPLDRPSTEDLPEKVIAEPSVERVADECLRRYLKSQCAWILLEAFTSEHSARMIAMKNATDNAAEMIHHLTLVRNKARQAAITKELIEVVSGAEALK